MSMKRKLSGLNRTNLENKTTNQLKKTFEKHYNNLDKSLPKWIQNKKSFSENDINKIKNTLTRNYTSEIKKENTIEGQYKLVKNMFNKKVKNTLNKYLQGKSDIEKRYIKGETIHIPTIQINGFNADKIKLKEIGKEEFSDKKAMKERTKQIKKNISKLNKLSSSDFYNTKTNDKVFNEVIEALTIADMSNSKGIEQLINTYKNLSPFEKEIFIKARLNKLIEKYLNDNNDELNDVAAYYIYNEMVKSMHKIYEVNRGYDLS